MTRPTGVRPAPPSFFACHASPHRAAAGTSRSAHGAPTDNARTTALPTIFRTHPGRGNAPPGLLREREALLLSPGCVDPIHCVRPVGKTRLLQCSHSVLRWTRTDAVYCRHQGRCRHYRRRLAQAHDLAIQNAKSRLLTRRLQKNRARPVRVHAGSCNRHPYSTG